MQKFDDLALMPGHFSGRVRLFPLPNLVLFPHVMQPLHIFEQRYRDLFEDALAGDRLVAMALLAPGWEMDYEGRPEICPMACLGRIATHVRLADGTFNALVLGLKRVRLLHEVGPRRRFREAEVELCEDIVPQASLTRQKGLQQKLRDAMLRILPLLPEAQEHLDQLLGCDVPLGVLTDVVSYMLSIDMASKQLLLTEPNVFHRAELLLDHLSEVETAANAAMSGFPPSFSDN